MSQLFRDIFSKASLKTAWIRVRDNRGCRGSDGVTIDKFESDLQRNLQSLANDITDNNYFPFPLLRFSIPKRKSTGVRYLSVPTVRDRVAQAAAYLGCREIFEKEFESISHAYRQGRGTRTAIDEIRSWRQKGYRFALDVDIDDYFDSVPHDLLIKKLETLLPEPELTHIFERWIRVEVYDGKKIWWLQKGIPQGSVVSPILANLYLDELDEMLMSFDRKLVRFADDFLILCKNEKEAKENIELTDMILEEMKLDLNPLKTKIVSFDKGFKFLGAIFLFDDIYLPWPQKRRRSNVISLPPPLTLKRYLELKQRDLNGR